MINRNIFEDILKHGELIIVGSSKFKNNPRDLDVVLVLDDIFFDLLFNISPNDYVLMAETGNWSDNRLILNAYILGCRAILQERLQTNLMIDLRILSKGLYNYYTKLYNKEI